MATVRWKCEGEEKKKSITETPICTRPEMMALTAFAVTWEKFPRVCVGSQGMLKSSQMVCEWLEAAPCVVVHGRFVHLIPVRSDRI